MQFVRLRELQKHFLFMVSGIVQRDSRQLTMDTLFLHSIATRKRNTFALMTAQKVYNRNNVT